MRKELVEAVGGLVGHADTEAVVLTEEENELLLKVANLVTLARTAVDRDFKGEVIDAHAPEHPTRLSKQLAQIVRSGVAIGMDRPAAMKLALRCARDTIPPLRIMLLRDLAENPYSQVHELRERLDKPWNTLRRELDALHTLGLVTCAVETIESDDDEKKGDEKKGPKKKFTYNLKTEQVDDKLVLLTATGVEPEDPPF